MSSTIRVEIISDRWTKMILEAWLTASRVIDR
jgi:hypothetical protein